MEQIPNGFTGFANRDAHFESAAQAMWRNGQTIGASQAPNLNAVPANPLKAGALKYMSETEANGQKTLTFDPEKLAAIERDQRRWSWMEVDLNAIRHNCFAIRQRVGSAVRVMAVVKADAYGHGAVKVAQTALAAGVDYLGVAAVDEGIKLREAMVNAPILILSEPPAEAIPLLLAYKIIPSIYTSEFAIQYAEAADMLGMRAPFHLAVNTGMNRIGVHSSEVVEFLHRILFHRSLDMLGMFTHFATADEPETLEFQMQLRRFKEAVEGVRAAGIDPGIVHCANTAAAIRYPEAHFDMVRFGIGLYGVHPSNETRGLIDLKPVMSIKARITDVRTPAMSEGVSYGLHYRSPGSVKVCTVPLGYADGLRRSLSSRITFLVNGIPCKQVGNICMDQCMFEVDLRTYGTRPKLDPQVGDEVVILGEQGDYSITLDDMANMLGTISYEVACGFGARMAKVYV